MNGIIWLAARLAASDCDDPYFGCSYDDAVEGMAVAGAITVVVSLILIVAVIAAIARSRSSHQGPGGHPVA